MSISHNLPHVFEVADRIQAMRLGKRVGIARLREQTIDDIVAMLTGASKAEPAAAGCTDRVLEYGRKASPARAITA